MLQVGSLLDNKYKILNEIGHGGMSVVYLAINERANKTWAVKEIRKDGTCNFEAVKQGLVVETDMLKKLNHPHLPSIIDVIDMDDSFIIVMDYIEGRSLQSVIKASGAQPKELVVEWGKQLCDVLGYLHSREPAIIYRDMKPANVMLKPSGDVTLIDFGTAREFKDRTMVEDTTCLGTRGYAAPEQFGGRGQTDARTDIYCLGATLYHLLTGHSPAEPPYEIKPLSYWDPTYAGSGMERIINKCCQADPSARYQSCAELMYDLEHISDMDDSVMNARRMKWTAFVASVAVFFVGVAGMLGFTLAKNSATTETYDYYLAEAEALTSSNSFPEFVNYVKDAIAVDPGKYAAYDLLLSRVEEDGRYDDGEHEEVYACLRGSVGGNAQSNESYLLDESQESYAEAQFRVGKLLFLMSSGQEDNLREAASYFKRALEQGEMDPDTADARLARTLQTIGEEYANLGQGNWYTDAEYSYGDLWDSLSSLIHENSIDDLGSNSAYGIALYSRVASIIVANNAEFAAENGKQGDDGEAHVTKAGVEALLQEMSDGLQETIGKMSPSAKSRLEALTNSATDNISVAMGLVSAWEGDEG